MAGPNLRMVRQSPDEDVVARAEKYDDENANANAI